MVLENRRQIGTLSALGATSNQSMQVPTIPARLRNLTAAAAIAATASVVAVPNAAHAASLIRDSEIETLIRDYAHPIIRAAGLGTRGIKIHVIQDLSFNAFVVDGQNIFIFAGALLDSETPNQIIGVIAHEAGHIAGGHLARLRTQVKKAQTASLAAQIIGIAAVAAAAIGGAGATTGQAGAAILHGGSAIARRSVLMYQRVEESSADQAAVSYLTRTGQSARGMLETFERLAQQELTSLKFVDPYARSHPLAGTRVAQLRSLAGRSRYYGRYDAPELQLRHDLMRAKLAGYIQHPQTVMRRYPNRDRSLPARYARAIATCRLTGVQSGRPYLDQLTAERPNSPYFHEIKGEFLLKAGKVREAIPALRKAVKLAGKQEAALMRMTLAKALLATDDPRHVASAIKALRSALRIEPRSALGYRHLATAFQRRGKRAKAELASAHSYLYSGKLALAKKLAKRAQKKLPKGAPGWVQAEIIIKSAHRR